MAKHRRWMPLDVADYIGDTQHLTTVEHGAYLLLIMHYWQHGSLPDDDQQLARITRLSPYLFQKFRTRLQKFFRPGWRHKRIDKELQRAEEIHERRSMAGVIGSSKRWQTGWQNDSKAIHKYKEYITTTESVPRSKEEASRESKKPELKASEELASLERKRRQ